MSLPLIPGRTAILAISASAAAILLALLVGVTPAAATRVATAALVTLCAAAAWDYRRSVMAWRRSAPVLTRRLPAAFAIGVGRPVQLLIDTQGSDEWYCTLYDHADASLLTDVLPIQLTLAGGKRVETSYTAMPTRRGEVTFAPADVRVRSRWGFCELLERLGQADVRRVYPDFTQVARYAWLAGDRRLQEIGIKTYQQRGQGTDFKQLSEYRVGDDVRHIDWRATLRVGKPIVRQFQDERDQCVLLLVDCGRRMRADERENGIGTSHFDQVLNAVMAELSDVEPTPTHSDYVAAAQDLLRRQHKRSLVVVITNFRDEDSAELGHALRLLRSRHLVLLASLRERIVGELLDQPLTTGDAAVEIASAHLYEQSRRDAFNRLASSDGTMVDAEPQRLGIELVNRYHAMKRAGRI